MSTLTIHPKKTALVLIDLQNGIVGLPLQPRTGAEVVAATAPFAQALREKGVSIVYVNVALTEMFPLETDRHLRNPNDPPPPAEASELVPAAGFQSDDIFVTKKQWGAFGSTDLAQQLRQRGIDTIILGGIATNMGVESTAREAASLGINVILAEDLCATLSSEFHQFALTTIFPLLGRVRSTDEILKALA